MINQVSISAADVEAFGQELDNLRSRVVSTIGNRDREYIYRILKIQRYCEVSGRVLMYFWFLPPLWLLAVILLGISKILNNMEIGHNIMHGQYDWMDEHNINSKEFEWDIVSPSGPWRHSHNHLHHTYTNIVGKDRDLGYGILRIVREQKWNPYYLGNLLWAILVMFLFEWGVVFYELKVETMWTGRHWWNDIKNVLPDVIQKIAIQSTKDYLIFPLLSGPLFITTLLGNALANVIRNVWAFVIIFCGHFPGDVQTFTEEETMAETRGEWYLRQVVGSANITGGRLLHVMSGNLSFQIEHHLFPDIPACRYREIAEEVRPLCEKYGVPYNTGRLSRQIASTWKKLALLSLPNGWINQRTEMVVHIERQEKYNAA